MIFVSCNFSLQGRVVGSVHLYGSEGQRLPCAAAAPCCTAVQWLFEHHWFWAILNILYSPFPGSIFAVVSVVQ